MPSSNHHQSNPSGRKPHVVVAMSGGVDSSVAAALLVQEGYSVTGIMMRLWSDSAGGETILQNRCCTPDQIAVARKVADKLGIRLYVIDVQDYFYKSVVQYFIDGHAKGLTPNPCIACNQHIRFDYLLENALSLGADYLATGHYARVVHRDGEYQLLKARDNNKDQSYVLYTLHQNQLRHLMFPIGRYPKSEVREIAAKYDLGIGSKAESMDLCFLADGDYRSFLQRRMPDEMKNGQIVDQTGRLLGEHSGLQNYTIGQRKGLGVSSGRPLYVLSKNIDGNKIVVGSREELGRKSLFASEVNWLSGKFPDEDWEIEVKIRYRATPVPAAIKLAADDYISIGFDEPLYGVTAGQAAVVYIGQRCLGGGLISEEAAG